MVTVYGIKTCGSVRNALKFFKEHNIEVNFVDIRKTPVDCDKISYWLEHISIDKLFNNKGTKYRNLKLKELNLDDEGKKKWLCDENMLLKRPIIEYGTNKVHVAYNIEEYEQKFL